MASIRRSIDQQRSSNKDHTFEDWAVHCSDSHILPSQCSQPCSQEKPCAFCFFTRELSLPHLPEMVYPSNQLKLVHKSGTTLEFNALDALKMVKSENKSVKIACAEDWRRARQESGLMNKTIGEYDWTFSTDYKGSWSGTCQIEATDLAIDINKLKQREEILLYQFITLFEDELHDNGVSLCSVRIRVMPSGFFILLRFFLRVDGVILSVHDTRIYHEFKSGYILSESSHREGKVSELKLPLYIMNDPDEVAPLLPLINITREKVTLASSESLGNQ